jgi:hypothetical protein
LDDLLGLVDMVVVENLGSDRYLVDFDKGLGYLNSLSGVAVD